MIYVVEDDRNIRELVVYTLNSTGLEAKGYADWHDFQGALAVEIPELVLLDIMLPGTDGVQILHNLRADPQTEGVPIIMVTAKSAEVDKVRALDLGADDYVTKPFGMMELVSRIRAVLRRTRGGKGTQQESDGEKIIETPLKVGAITLDELRHTVTVDGYDVVLALKEYMLLEMLMENEGIVLTRDRLLDDVWGYEFHGETRTVDVHVRTLRKKLGAAGRQIETVRGVGYKIVSQPEPAMAENL
ncbi:MAG: response regulator transcription factor [Actinomycetaceae bacterium]|nr:response regulator transcription factor [Actinomycetaceae bacterium]MDY6082259.1 response regulator transcription factor [Actinomycetaceae bacterium]